MPLELTMDFDWFILIRLFAAAFAGGVIGIERGGSRHEAGLRTHMLVSIGAAAIMVISECMVAKYGVPDQIVRMGAQVVSGVGFIGAGCIIIDGTRVRGITTAAGLWSTACLGLVIGSGFYIIGAVMLIIMTIIIRCLKSFAHKNIVRFTKHTLELELEQYGSASAIISELSRSDIIVKSLHRKFDEESENQEFPRAILTLEVMIPSDLTINIVIEKLGPLSGVTGIKELAQSK